MVKCAFCGRDMLTAKGCRKITIRFVDGSRADPIKVGAPGSYGMILSWARVSSFHQQEKWGHIIFSNNDIKPLPVNWSTRSPINMILCLNHTIIGGNNLEFTIN